MTNRWDDIDDRCCQLASRLTEEFDKTPLQATDRQVLCLAEEVGELVGAYRRATGRARRSGSWRDVEDELADVVITALVTAHTMGWDLSAIVERKLQHVETRGLRESPS